MDERSKRKEARKRGALSWVMEFAGSRRSRKAVRHADQIFVIDNGHIAEKGTHEELMKRNGIYKTFVEGRREAASWKLTASV